MFVIAGASGRSGRVVAETLLSQKMEVRLVAREAKRVEPLKSRGAEVAVASLDDEHALGRALEGAAGFYTSCRRTRRSWTRGSRPPSLRPLPPPLSTGALSFWVHLESLGLSPSTHSTDELLRRVEPYVHVKLIQDLPEISAYTIRRRGFCAKRLGPLAAVGSGACAQNGTHGSQT